MQHKRLCIVHLPSNSPEQRGQETTYSTYCTSYEGCPSKETNTTGSLRPALQYCDDLRHCSSSIESSCPKSKPIIILTTVGSCKSTVPSTLQFRDSHNLFSSFSSSLSAHFARTRQGEKQTFITTITTLVAPRQITANQQF